MSLTTRTTAPAAVLASTLCAAALLWFAGPLLRWGDLAPLQTRPALVAAVAAVLLAGAALTLWRHRRALRDNDRLLRGLLDGGATVPGTPETAPGDAEVALLTERFSAAVTLLRRARLGGRHPRLAALAGRPLVYQLPWVVLIGAPGTGKTTALRHSGLEFPLADVLGDPSLQGLGGTRHCDWWFAREAVLVDTAGRYTTHESRPEVDRAAWQALLSLLQRHRPRRPVDAVLLAVSAQDLLGRDAAWRQQHGRELRARLTELRACCGTGVPVYLLVTKIDLMAGFVEFFADFDREDREQAWGVTLPWQPTQGEVPDPLPRLELAFAALERRLDECMLERLPGEPDRDRRALVYAFPQQWRQLRESLGDLLQVLLEPEADSTRPLLRGAYFTSATQEGRPMDRVLGELSRALGLGGHVVAPGRSGGRSYFVTRLLREVVVAEAGLGGQHPGWVRRRAQLHAGVAAAAVLAVLGVGGIAVQRIVEERLAVQRVMAQLQPAQASVATLRSLPESDLRPPLPALDVLAALGGVAGSPTSTSSSTSPAPNTPPTVSATGASPAPLAAAARDAYRRVLREGFLPRIAARLEARLREGSRGGVVSVYETLRAYLMLFAGRNADASALRGYLLTDWNETLPPAVDPAQRRALRTHLDRLLQSGELGAPSEADAQLVADSRALVAGVPLAERAYLRLRQLDAAGSAGSFTVEGEAGPTAARLLPGAPVVPGFYTRTAYEDALRRQTREVMAQFAREQAWVLGTPAGPASSDAGLSETVARRYAADYLRHWQAFADGLRLAPASSLADGAALAAELARPEAPLLALLRGLVRETTVEAPPGAASPREAFDELRRYLGGTDTPALTLQRHLAALATELNAAQVTLARGQLPPPPKALRDAAQAARSAPQPLQRLLGGLIEQSGAHWAAELREPLARRIATEVAPACRQTLQGRYPLQRDAAQELTRDAFAAAFGAGGMFEAFHQRHLSGWTDASAPASWRQPLAGLLTPFERAAAIRAQLLPGESRRLASRLELQLLSLDAPAGELVIAVDERVLRLRRDGRGAAGASQTLVWPGDGPGVVRIRLGTADAASPAYAFEGPWSLLRLLDRVRVEPGATADRAVLLFDVEGRRARVEVRGPAVATVVTREGLERFECPR